MTDDRCVVEVGTHPGPYWKCKKTGLRVCDRHKTQYEEREGDLGYFDWEKIDA